nr:unnamed protein product [Callosobruchus analis]
MDKNTVFASNTNACSTLKRFYSTYMTDIWRRSGVKYPDKCPIPPIGRTAVPVQGRVRLTISLIDMTTKKSMLCAILYVQVS